MSRKQRSIARLAGLVGLVAVVSATSFVQAAPRDDIRGAYDKALILFNDLDLDQALATVEAGIRAAEGGGASADPALASLHMLRAALLYSAKGDAAKGDIAAALDKAVALNYFVVVPMEVRSPQLNKYLQDARGRAGAKPSEPIRHTAPGASCGNDIVFEALLSVPDGGQAAVYWRKVGEAGFDRALEMEVFSNVADGILPAAEHGDADLEYFIYAFDASQQPVANKGSQDAPLRVEQKCSADSGDGGTSDEPGEPDAPPTKRTKGGSGPSALPRVWINIGLGTGLGIARGSVDQTYQQYFPGPGNVYSAAQAGCAIARWASGEGELVDAATLSGGDPSNPSADSVFGAFGGGFPGGPAALAQAYQATQGTCGERHAIKNGLALAPFHIAPEVQVRVSKRISLSLFSRLQVVTGSKVYRDDPTKSLPDSFNSDVYTADPATDYRAKPPFAWSVGVKLRYYFLKDDAKFRLFAGGFAGYGNARLRVPMGFSNDRNGNSVPDEFEVPNNGVSGGGCFPVWPYAGGCTSGSTDVALANGARANADKSERVDTVTVGPGFVGALFGFNYQIVKNFALYGEISVGGWFPKTGSMLIDLTVGPAVTF